MTERWKACAGPGLDGYQVSSLGRIRSNKKGSWRLLKTWPNAQGYPVVGLYVPGCRVTAIRRVHQLVLAAFRGPCPDGMEPRHVNGIRMDVRLRNLKYGTPKENQQDRKKHGTSNGPGRRHNHVTQKQAGELKKELDAGVSVIKLSRKSGVSRNTLDCIQRGIPWPL